jgi:peptide/nickel transport system ATP-binding protein
MTAPLLSVQDLRKDFTARGMLWKQRRVVRAVDNVSFDLAAGQTLSLVGESGSGKTTTAKCLLRLIEPTSGSVQLEGQELVGMGRGELKSVRRQAQFIFQDPYASLNPRMTAGDIVAEPMRNFREGISADASGKCVLRSCCGAWVFGPRPCASCPMNSPVVNGNASGSPGHWRSGPD